MTKELSVHLSRAKSKLSNSAKFRYDNWHLRNHDFVSAPVRDDFLPKIDGNAKVSQRKFLFCTWLTLEIAFVSRRNIGNTNVSCGKREFSAILEKLFNCACVHGNPFLMFRVIFSCLLRTCKLQLWACGHEFSVIEMDMNGTKTL